MARLQVLVDGESRYDGEVDDWQIPAQPDLFPAALRAQVGGQPTPLARLFMLTAFTDLIRRTLESPMLQPLEYDMKIRGRGCFTLTVDTPRHGGQP